MTERTAKPPRVDARSPIKRARLILKALRRRPADRYEITRQARKGDPDAVEAARLADEAIRRGVGVHEVALRSGELVETLLDDRASLRGLLRDLKEDLRIALSQFSEFKKAIQLLLGIKAGQEASAGELAQEIIDRNTTIARLEEKIKSIGSERDVLAGRLIETEGRYRREKIEDMKFVGVLVGIREELERTKRELETAQRELMSFRAREREITSPLRLMAERLSAGEIKLAERTAELIRSKGEALGLRIALSDLTQRTEAALGRATQELRELRAEVQKLRSAQTPKPASPARKPIPPRSDDDSVVILPDSDPPPTRRVESGLVVSGELSKDISGEGYAISTRTGNRDLNEDSAGVKYGKRIDVYIVADGYKGSSADGVLTGKTVVEHLLSLADLDAEVKDVRREIIRIVKTADGLLRAENEGEDKPSSAFSALVVDKKNQRTYFVNCGYTKADVLTGTTPESAAIVSRPSDFSIEIFSRHFPEFARSAVWSGEAMNLYETCADSNHGMVDKMVSMVGVSDKALGIVITEIPYREATTNDTPLVLLSSAGVSLRPQGKMAGVQDAIIQTMIEARTAENPTAKIAERVVDQAIDGLSPDNVTAVAVALSGCELLVADARRYVHKFMEGKVLAQDSAASSVDGVAPPPPSTGSSSDQGRGEGKGNGGVDRVEGIDETDRSRAGATALAPIVLSRADGHEDHEYDGGHFAIISKKGNNPRRPTNEDSEGYARLKDGTQIFCLADGAGEMGNGDVASRIAVQAYLDARKARQDMVQAFQSAYKAVIDYANEHPDCEKMTTTFVVSEISGDGKEMKVLSAGDSRAKVVDLESHKGAVLTTDQNGRMNHWISERLKERDLRVGEKIDGVHFTPAIPDELMGEYERWESPWPANSMFGMLVSKANLTAAIGKQNRNRDDQEIIPSVFVRTIPLIPSGGKNLARLILSCDGLCDEMPEQQVTFIVREMAARTPFDVANALVKESLRDDSAKSKKASGDNVSVIVVDLQGNPDLGGMLIEYFAPDADQKLTRKAGHRFARAS